MTEYATLEKASLSSIERPSSPEPVQMNCQGLSPAAAQSEELRLQMKGGIGADAVHAAAGRGVEGCGGGLPHLDRVQRAFGRHDVSHVEAHVGGAAEEANQAMSAEAYTTGGHVAFKGAPSLHTAAHEAAHVVQQQVGVSLKAGVGRTGDPYERHADAVADAVVQGRSAEGLLDGFTGEGNHTRSVQRQAAGTDTDVQEDADRVLGRLQDLLADAEAPPKQVQSTSEGESGAAGTQQTPPEVAQLRETIARFTALKSGGDAGALGVSTRALLEALEGEAPTPSPTPEAPVQQTAAVLAAPLAVAGPPGWVVLGVLAVGTLVVGAMAYSEHRSRTRTRVRPRTRDNDRAINHRGRLQVQGGGLELSFPWSRNIPMTKVEATAGLAGLRAVLGRRDLSLRDQAFVRAEAFILSTLHSAPPPLSRTFQNSNLPSNRRDARVDVEIWTGVAFA